VEMQWLRDESARLTSERNAELRKRLENGSSRVDHNMRPTSPPTSSSVSREALDWVGSRRDDWGWSFFEDDDEAFTVVSPKLRSPTSFERPHSPLHSAQAPSRAPSLDRLGRQQQEEGQLGSGRIGGAATASLVRLDDGINASMGERRKREAEESRAIAAATNRPPWDSSRLRTMPPALHGLKPVTREPWADDQEVGKFTSCWMREDGELVRSPNSSPMGSLGGSRASFYRSPRSTSPQGQECRQPQQQLHPPRRNHGSQSERGTVGSAVDPDHLMTPTATSRIKQRPIKSPQYLARERAKLLAETRAAERRQEEARRRATQSKEDEKRARRVAELRDRLAEGHLLGAEEMSFLELAVEAEASSSMHTLRQKRWCALQARPGHPGHPGASVATDERHSTIEEMVEEAQLDAVTETVVHGLRKKLSSGRSLRPPESILIRERSSLCSEVAAGGSDSSVVVEDEDSTRTTPRGNVNPEMASVVDVVLRRLGAGLW
jgi:anti-sigma28 factor (negative regulator of flagellin synthesis)